MPKPRSRCHQTATSHRSIMKFLILLAVAGTTYGILTKGAEKNPPESTKKSDQIDAQASHSHHHSVYGGFGDNGLNEGFGGIGAYGDSYNGFDHGHGHDHHHHDHHHHEEHHDNGYHKALAIKGLLVPLAGVALLGAAAAFVSNPILLQLGVISGSYVGRRRREIEPEAEEAAARLEAQTRLSQIQILERFMSQVPKEQIFSQEKKLMASYLSCSGMTEENQCLERLACELRGPVANQMPEETHVMNIIANEIFNNDLVPAKTKKLMSEAARVGKEGGDCLRYRCSDLESLITSYRISS